jgi:hypothetical protein
MTVLEPTPPAVKESDHDTPIEIRLSAPSRHWRRRLGPLPWAALEELALCAQADEHGWVAVVGVRSIGAAVGVTKNTAARAVAALRSNHLVSPHRVKTPDGRSLSAYRIHLPDGITIRTCSDKQDTPLSTFDASGVCPKGEYTRCPEGQCIAYPDEEEDHYLSDRQEPARHRITPHQDGLNGTDMVAPDQADDAGANTSAVSFTSLHIVCDEEAAS